MILPLQTAQCFGIGSSGDIVGNSSSKAIAENSNGKFLQGSKILPEER